MRPKILIVDDNKELRETLIQFIDNEGLDVDLEQASSGELAIQIARENKPDIVLMDLRLPKMNGIDAAERIKEENPKTKIFVLTMFEVEEFKRAYSKDKIEAIIPKSEMYDRLIPLLRKCL